MAWAKTICGRLLVIGAGATLAALAGEAAGQEICWDNDIVPNGSSGRATSPPAFPNIRVVDDITVPPGAAWTVRALYFSNHNDAGWTTGPDVEVLIYADAGGCPGELLADRFTTNWAGERTGRQLFSREVWNYRIEFDDITLEPGKYHVGTRFPHGGGAGTTYWNTSNGGEGADRDPCLSLDDGQTWQIDLPRHRAFELSGSCPSCEPCPGDIDIDCDVDFGDLLILLANWTHDPAECDPPGTCGNFVNCLGRDHCFCFTLPDGSGFCGRAEPCGLVEPCDENDGCREGFVCEIGTCCPQNQGNVCVPVSSGCSAAPAALAAPGELTTAGFADARAAESDSGCNPPPPGDIDGDCDVDFGDLLILLAGWNSCAPS